MRRGVAALVHKNEGCDARRYDNAERLLGHAAVAALGELADMVKEDRLLGRGEMRGVLGYLGQEGIVEQNRSLVAVASGRVAEQGGDVHLQGASEAIERGQGRHGLAILDFGDIGAGHSHTRGELALREVADVAKIAHGGSYLRAGFVSFGWGIQNQRNDGLDFGRLGQQRLLAATAGV